MKRLSLLFSALMALSSYASAQVIPPPVEAANRSLLMNLVATNIFGQNTPAIASTEADYMEMWAQDVTAMEGYHAGAASVTSSFSAIFSPVTFTVDYSNSESLFTFTSGSIPAGDTGYELTIQLKSSMPDLQFDESEPISDFDLENDFTLTYSDGVNISGETGTVQSFDVTDVPEPSTWAMLLGGVAMLGRQLRRRA